ncbi:methylglutaconyl-CoA hydratase [Sphingobacterium allocomposti]|uniref:Methylglutaconyl-CoA hydratase n=1 Tax=Sphingobacterium allocomposti TaxID=415956 RepID=A0A5S5D0D5_9SPHI|nr:enoyl-CoA hydratase/isomerase family protein [Sphingobacterium composti Yoo et al. 2007 non Ten et al. 2007]TYP88814.1 methylglutaconyl-CoA hydratase [Sphingobacterium composti Yoo et al. 2007 non Ten et al. 2007]
MNYNYIRTDTAAHVFTLTLARPEKRNAFTPSMVSEIAHALDIANKDDTIKLVLVRAEGPVFCAGMDLHTFRDPSMDVVNPAVPVTDSSLGEVMDSLRKPSIAIVEGDVIAGGFLLVLGCTYVFARSAVRFRLPEVALGIFPFQVMASLYKVMPEKQVLQLCLETEYFDIEKALRLGIVDAIYEEAAVTQLIASFKELDTRTLSAGIGALRKLPSIAKDKHYSFLKECLENLRDEKN